MSSTHRKGPKIDELARELGVKPRALLRVAADLDVTAQNRLTRIAHSEADRIRARWAQIESTKEPVDEAGNRITPDG